MTVLIGQFTFCIRFGEAEPDNGRKEWVSSERGMRKEERIKQNWKFKVSSGSGEKCWEAEKPYVDPLQFGSDGFRVNLTFDREKKSISEPKCLWWIGLCIFLQTFIEHFLWPPMAWLHEN